MTKKTVLITGASGFIGRPLVNKMLDDGYSVRAATRGFAQFPNSVDVAIIPDLMNTVDWKPVLAGVNIVIHLAGMAHADVHQAVPGAFDKVNRLATENLAKATKENEIKRFVFISSIRAQVGPSAVSTVREEDDARPTNDYGRSKLAAEMAVRTFGVPFTILRPVAVYGPYPKGNVRSLMQLAKTPFPLPFLGLSGRRSLISIDNFISAVSFALNTPATAGETYLIADPASFTLAEVVTMLRKAQGRPPGLFNLPPKLFRFALHIVNQGELWPRLGEDLVVDSTKLQRLGWRPAVDTYDGIVAMMRAESDANSQQA